jgi:hypothetical protein
MKERRQSKFPPNDIAKKIALITGGNIHNGERETSLPSRAGVNERVIRYAYFHQQRSGNAIRAVNRQLTIMQKRIGEHQPSSCD